MEDVFIAVLRHRGLAKPMERDEMPASGSPARVGGSVAAIEADALTRDFGKFRAVDGVTFRVARGEIFGLLGSNGSGKTTVIKMLTGILRPSEGSGRVAGEDMRGASRRIKERIGYMSQTFSLYTDLTVLENIRLYARIYGLGPREARARINWVVEMAQLAGHEGELADSLPMGLRQRLALGCALVHRPQVLFLDEPTSGVDPLGRRQFWDILFNLSREEGVAILVTTHYMSEVEHCDRLALLHAGKIVADAPPDVLKQEVEAEAGQVLAVSCATPAAAMAQLTNAGFAASVLHGRRVHLLSRTPESDCARVVELLGSDEFGTVEVSSRPLSMEDVFIYRVTALERREDAA
jgi:ABC-2 type transport system ATP-binding protein